MERSPVAWCCLLQSFSLRCVAGCWAVLAAARAWCPTTTSRCWANDAGSNHRAPRQPRSQLCPTSLSAQASRRAPHQPPPPHRHLFLTSLWAQPSRRPAWVVCLNPQTLASANSLLAFRFRTWTPSLVVCSRQACCLRRRAMGHGCMHQWTRQAEIQLLRTFWRSRQGSKLPLLKEMMTGWTARYRGGLEPLAWRVVLNCC